MKISVCMAIYNTKEDFLRAAIESILAQTFNDFEFLIVNDSPVNVKLDEIVRSYDDPRIVYLKNDRNMGVIYSRNRMLKMAKGEYMAIMDHDDIALPERLQLECEYLDAHEDVGVVGGYAMRIPSNKILRVPLRDYDIKMALVSDCPFVFPSVVIRKAAMLDNNILFEEDMDYGLWCRLSCVTHFHNLAKVFIRYRIHEVNMSAVTDFREIIAKAQRNYIEKNPAVYDSYAKSRVVVRRFKIFGVLLFKMLESQSFRRCYLFGVVPLWTELIKEKKR